MPTILANRNTPAPSDIRKVKTAAELEQTLAYLKSTYGMKHAVSKFHQKYEQAKRYIAHLRDPASHKVEIAEAVFDKMVDKAVSLLGTTSARALAWTMRQYADAMFLVINFSENSLSAQRGLYGARDARSRSLEVLRKYLSDYDSKGVYIAKYRTQAQVVLKQLSGFKASVNAEKLKKSPRLVVEALAQLFATTRAFDVCEERIDELFGAWITLEQVRALSVQALARYARSTPQAGSGLKSAVDHGTNLQLFEKLEPSGRTDAVSLDEKNWTDDIDSEIAWVKRMIVIWLKEEAAYEEKVSELRLADTLASEELKNAAAVGYVGSFFTKPTLSEATSGAKRPAGAR